MPRIFDSIVRAAILYYFLELLWLKSRSDIFFIAPSFTNFLIKPSFVNGSAFCFFFGGFGSVRVDKIEVGLAVKGFLHSPRCFVIFPVDLSDEEWGCFIVVRQPLQATRGPEWGKYPSWKDFQTPSILFDKPAAQLHWICFLVSLWNIVGAYKLTCVPSL